MACGSCTAGSSGTFQSQSLGPGTRPQGSSSTMTVFWIQASFPNFPCSSPHVIRAEWREPGVTSWAIIGTTSSVRLLSGVASASIGPFPTTNVLTIGFPVAGTFEVRAARPVCGPAFVSTTVSYTIFATNKRFVRSGASIL